MNTHHKQTLHREISQEKRTRKSHVENRTSSPTAGIEQISHFRHKKKKESTAARNTKKKNQTRTTTQRFEKKRRAGQPSWRAFSNEVEIGEETQGAKAREYFLPSTGT
jgi:hypothetical protein